MSEATTRITTPPAGLQAAYATRVQAVVRATLVQATTDPGLRDLARYAAEAVTAEQDAFTWYPEHRDLLTEALVLWGCKAATRAKQAVVVARLLQRVVSERGHSVHSVAAHLAVDTILACGRGWAPLVMRDAVAPVGLAANKGNPRRRHFAEGLAWALCGDGIGPTPWCRRDALVAGGTSAGDVLHALHHLATAPGHAALQPERRPC